MKYLAIGLNLDLFDTFMLWFWFFSPYVAIILAIILFFKFRKREEGKKYYMAAVYLLGAWGIFQALVNSEYMTNFIT